MSSDSSFSPESLADLCPDFETAKQVAYDHLPEEVADAWIRMCRPAVSLSPAEQGEPVVARFGGIPRMPEEISWPEWEGHGPLSFVAEVDLSALTEHGLRTGLDLPEQGRLLFFYYVNPEDPDALVFYEDHESLSGARVLYVTETAADSPRRVLTDESVTAYPEVKMTGTMLSTFPEVENSRLYQEFADQESDGESWLDLANDDDFREALAELEPETDHRIGGWPLSLQGPVELEAAASVLDASLYDSPEYEGEARSWRLLLQVSSSDEMIWGDSGMLYWFLREGSTGKPLPTSTFTWQCL
ncbi:YwqG family protein [Austwickia chelonae]|uniref:YwqG family protein n=1 Tax=Austwickia chelonae TaxID=100225 RepID=UPI000E278648|nr:YwqG family protein [Austwickia chelonae]